MPSSRSKSEKKESGKVTYVRSAATRAVNREDGPQVEERKADESGLLSGPTALQYRLATRPRKSFGSSLGLGDGFAGGMTAAALLVFLLVTIGVPAAFLKHHVKQGGAATPDQFLPEVLSHTVKPEASEDKVPVTPNLVQSFCALRLSRDQGLLSAAAGDDWAEMRERLLLAIEQAEAPVKPEPQQGKEQQELDFRKAMAMDLACLENAAVEAQVAIDEEPGSSGECSPEIAAMYKAKIEARRRQARAAELWGVAVEDGLIGEDQALRESVLRVLMAVRSRAVASEHLTFLMMESQQPEQAHESVQRQHAEADKVYEATKSLVVAGQIAAAHPQVKAEVADWLPIIFTSI